MTRDDIDELQCDGISNKKTDKICDIALAVVLAVVIAFIFASFGMAMHTSLAEQRDLSLIEYHPTDEEIDAEVQKTVKALNATQMQDARDRMMDERAAYLDMIEGRQR